MEIIGSIAKEEFATDKQWPDLMNFIQATIQSHDAKQIEVTFIWCITHSALED